MASPVVVLSSTWMVGELVGLGACLAPGLLLGRWTATGTHLGRRVLLQVVAFGGLLLFVLPTLIFTVSNGSWEVLVGRPRWHFVLAALVAAPAGAMALQAVREFAIVGKGTPVPLDPPHRLVVSGPYAYVANPMQLGATLIAVEWAVLLGSPAVFTGAVMKVVFSAGLASWNEGGELGARFGSDWIQYRAKVGSWFPTWRPYGDRAATVFIGSTCEPCSEVERFISKRKPLNLTIAAAESSPVELTRITYTSNDAEPETGIAALARTVEHINLAWATGAWIARLPVVAPCLQLVADAVGAGPRTLAIEHPPVTNERAD